MVLIVEKTSTTIKNEKQKKNRKWESEYARAHSYEMLDIFATEKKSPQKKHTNVKMEIMLVKTIGGIQRLKYVL